MFSCFYLAYWLVFLELEHKIGCTSEFDSDVLATRGRDVMVEENTK